MEVNTVKASELINELQKHIKVYGDLDIVILEHNDEFGYNLYKDVSDIYTKEEEIVIES